MRRTLLLAALLCGLIAIAPSAAPTAPAAAGDRPTGVTGLSLDNRVELSWLPVSGVTSYRVYRGSTPTTVTTQITPGAGVTGTTYADTTAVNGTTYYYAVRSVAGSIESPNSLVVQATPAARSCSTGNVVRLENCYPGNDDWNIGDNIPPAQGGIEGFATKTSINKGESVDLKVSTVQGSLFRIEIFRMGYYGGDGARLFSAIRNVPGVLQPSCYTEASTGLIDCSNWSVSAAITTTSSWPSGSYLIRVVRESGGQENHILLAVRDDSRNADLLYGIHYTDYQAYNYYGGKSLYDFSSTGATTVAGTPRAVKVSFDRPLEQTHRDRFVIVEYPIVYWLEQAGYDVAYTSNNDIDGNGAEVDDHLAYLLPGHDEYWSGGMRTALEQARDAGTSIISLGGNQVYWKTRFEASPVSGAAGRVMVCYKSTQSGGPDPSGIPTGTWRDPAGANKPENGLLGTMYVGDNDSQNFPMRVSQSEGDDPVWRYTSLATMTGAFTSFGQELVGWEWDSRQANGAEPPGVVTAASTPVSGQLVQNNGRDYIQGSTTTHVTRYTAASGAYVFAASTNFWKRGLALDGRSEGEPDLRIQQATTNVLADMGIWPTTPAANITLDSAVGPPTVTARTPAPGASGVLPAASVTATFSRPMNPSTITSSSFTLRRPDNSIVPATVTYAGAARKATLKPTGSLSLFTTYTARLETTIKAADGQALAAPVTWTFTTTATPPPPPTVTDRTPAAGATGVNRDTTVTATFDHVMDASTISATSFNLRTSGGALVPSAVTYNAATKTATLTPASLLAATSTYTARLETTILDSDGTALAAAVVWNFTTNASVCPCSLFSPTSFPQTSSLPTNDGHGSPTYELGVKITVDQPTLLEGIRFWKSSTETGTHIGRLWTATGTPLAQVTFTGETASGWQQQLLTTPIELQENTTYVISIGLNAFYGVTPAGLATQIVSGPLRTVVGQNGVYGNSAGTFPTNSFNNANYFIDVRATSAAGTPPVVSSTTPVAGATNVSLYATARATFSRAMNAGTITTSSFTLRRPDGTSVPASVTYDAATKTATLTPTSQLSTSTTYTGRLETSITASDGAALASVYTWSFTTAATPPAAPTVTATTPAAGETGVDRGSQVTATFSKAMDAATITGASFTLTPQGGSAVAASVSYDAATQKATLFPSSPLATSTTYTARLDSTLRAADGAPIAAAFTWTFTTSASLCPCSLFSSIQQPAQTNLETRDGRGGTGPWTYELGAKVRVDQAANLTAIRFYKAPLETGTHVGRVWTSTGTQLAQVTFTGETASGWQVQPLATPLALQPNTTYVVSVGFNTYYSFTGGGLSTQIDSGPLHSVADGQNGVYNTTAGSFPTSSYNSSNYFVDLRVSLPPPAPPTVTSTVPAAGATAVATTTTARATFSRDMDPATLTTSSFTLRRPDNSVVPASVSYSAASKTATLTPSGQLAFSTTYTARLETTVAASDGTALASAYTWSFTTGPAPPNAPTVTGRTPTPGVLGVDRDTSVTATFSRSMDGDTITGSSFTLTPQGGSGVPATVTYDDATATATLVPSALLSGATTYTARLETTIKAADGAALAAVVTWTFTTNSSSCPCTLFSSTLTPASTNLATNDGHGSTYELGVKLQVTEPMRLGSIRFYRATQETGTHVGRIWTTAGTQLAQVTFTGETASGWQQQALPTPLDLQANTTYIVSVGFNTSYSVTGGGLGTQVVSGPLRSVADGQNGVYGSAAGSFPTTSFNSGNYFIDARVTSPPPALASTAPAAGATGVATGTTVQATFSRALNAATVTGSTFTLTGPGGAVPATVAYNAGTQTATLTPSSALATSTTYTARLETGIQSADAIPLASAQTWSFTTTAPATPPTVTASSPASGATGVSRDTTVTATFSKPMNAATITGSTFTLTGPGGAVAASVAYDSGSQTATLTPTAQLAASTAYTARLETGIAASDGTTLASAVTWGFTTTGGTCPCSLFTIAQTPASTGNASQDGHGSSSYELGVKIQVTQAMSLTAIEFYKSPGETGTHVGRVWAVGGAQLAQVTFTGETSSGWQQKALTTPVALQPNTTYVVSVNANARYVLTVGGLSAQITSGPIRSVADGQNGVYGLSAGTYPNSSWNGSNYFVDVVVQ